VVPAVLLPGGTIGMRYRPFAARVLVMRVPWLAAALSVGALAADSLARTGHVAGLAGLVASGVVVAGLLVARRRPGVVRAVARRVMTFRAEGPSVPPWTAALGIAGYALGANWQNVANDFHGPAYAIAGLIVAGIVAAVVAHFRRRRRATSATGDRVVRPR